MLEGLRSQIEQLPRTWKRLILMGFDFIALSGALWLAFSLRYGQWLPPTTLSQLAVMLTAPVVAIPIFVRMGLYRAVLRYLPERALWTIVQAMAFAAIAWLLVAFVSELVVYGFVPRSVPFIYWLLGTVFVTGGRYAAKAILHDGWASSRGREPILIYGAGDAGAQLAVALSREKSTFVAAFIDDDPKLRGRDVNGIRVFGSSSLSGLIERYDVKEVVLSGPLGFRKRQEVVSALAEKGVKVRTLPSLAEVAQGKYLVRQIREIDIDQLLGRSSVPPDEELLAKMVERRNVMVTGAGGSIGSELCRLVARYNPNRLVLLEANEFALYNIDRELASNGLPVAVLGSVTDRRIVTSAICENKVDVIFHAAAHKHVPLIEANALEGIRNNVLGAMVLAEVALENRVQSFVLISSDKAVHPTNVMGATKRWAELIMWQKSRQALDAGLGQTFSAVRFGNVLGSNGSVVPLFEEQIARGGPITLTDERMTRYFMSIHEAAELIVQAGALSEGGDIFVLDMGSPILIKDLAKNMVRLAGLSIRDAENPEGDIEIITSGIRPGEKLTEELFYNPGTVQPTRQPKVLRVPHDNAAVADIEGAVGRMQKFLMAQDEQSARQLLFDLIRANPVS